ncbi:serine/threonine-protein phosphatase, partial [Acidobacteriia bacterium AH_259_A11_L15]|nr:serine/threonine-protein phosphatase [Acidobacteriia bacterium AH_259_A11_L15]
FLPYRDGRLALAVGDVAGKATAAALYGALAIGILRGHVVEHPCEPAEMLELMNEYLRQPRIENRFMALAFALYDPRSKLLSLANAGFPRPRLVRGGRVEEIQV